jgi:ABC-type proline/glycine betaine transport system permease subunit
MELLASLFVDKPLNILAMAFLFLAGYLALRFTALGITRHPRLLLIASTAWGLYASWEWLVKIKTPEANIRVDLLVMWPVLAILSAWALFRAFR